MGLISQFKEQKECKIVMILNERELDKLSDIDGKKHDEIFALYKEKIIDYSFHYQPSQEELFQAIKEDIKDIEKIEKITFYDHQTIYDFFKKIDLKNIRIMKQSLYLLKQFSFIASKGYDKKVIDEFVEIALNLFVFKAKSNYSHKDFRSMKEYTPHERRKRLQAIAKDSFDSGIEQEELEINEKHEANLKYYYSTRSSSGEYYSSNKEVIEKIIYNFIDNHITDESELKKQLDENNQHLDYFDKRNEISKLHKRSWTDFSSTNKEIATQLFYTLNKYKDDMHRLFHYSAYKPFIEYVKQFALDISTENLETEIAEKCLNFYIISPDHDKYGPLNNSSETDLIISHYPWAKLYRNKQKLLTIDPSAALSLIESVLASKYLSEDVAYKLKQISAKSYENLIKENPDFVEPLVKFLKMRDSKDVRTNIINALKSLKGKNNDYAWKVNQITKKGSIDLEEDK